MKQKEPEALKSLYRSPGNKKKDGVTRQSFQDLSSLDNYCFA
jgi:hypothetical protein